VLGWTAALLLSAGTLAHAQNAPSKVGAEQCKICHEDRWNQFQVSPHAGTRKSTGAGAGSAVDCESCHGPGSEHVAAGGDSTLPGFAMIRDFGKVPAAEANATCITCHQGGEHMHWAQSDHARRDVTCVSCHSIHSAKSHGGKALLATASTSELCLRCHVDKQVTMARTAHMPMREGGMTCVDCHNPHGTATNHQLRAANTNELCLSCHSDKRGPFLWEHAPVRENCLNCHEAHGSNNPNVLAGRTPFLCQRCHIATRHPSTLYDLPDLQSNRLFNRGCNNCHSQIHGSNHPSGKFFLR